MNQSLNKQKKNNRQKLVSCLVAEFPNLQPTRMHREAKRSRMVHPYRQAVSCLKQYHMEQIDNVLPDPSEVD